MCGSVGISRILVSGSGEGLDYIHKPAHDESNITTQETLPQQTGQALATLSRFDKPDTKTYENMETMLER